jgi:hypothetical protein
VKGYIRVSIALKEVDSTAEWALVDGDSVASYSGKDQRLPLLQQMIELGTKKRLPVLLLHKTPKFNTASF